ncbi:hypothetical protein FLAG1_08428 [Fusarium langsethiae]|uniref:6-phosphogluconolactonase n=2 Tax=Fusarium sambucinum species complex TaxID=569360 RepID=A0A0M9ESF9_FUSLA|nr:hypothetical protein FLAG1_08428 [Fusarium langsethiae]OBS20608.1 hypothetical protein FPOA_06959 [Fusarium poae]GKU05660.1 unnamed protein product [Fusarium langsethiae]
MKLAICHIILFLATVGFAKYEIDHFAINQTSSSRILVGHPGHIYVVNKVDGFPISSDKEMTGIPSWMASGRPNSLYAIDESSNIIRLFDMDLIDDKLTLKATKKASSGVVHLQFNTDNTRLISCAYGNGTIDVWNTTDGSLDLIKTIISPGQPGPNKERQASPHPHQANLDPTGRFFVINDLGTDSIIVIDSKDDVFQVTNAIEVLPSGCGPRHGVFYPQGALRATHYVVACEISNQVLVYAVSYGNNCLDFKQIQRGSTFGPDFPPTNATSAAAGAVLLASDNKNLYISNRHTGNSSDSISHFQINYVNSTSLSLNFISSTSTYGLSPRMMSFSEDERYILIANQGGGFGLVALERQVDGIIKRDAFSVLGAPEFAPQFIKQIT